MRMDQWFVNNIAWATIYSNRLTSTEQTGTSHLYLFLKRTQCFRKSAMNFMTEIYSSIFLLLARQSVIKVVVKLFQLNTFLITNAAPE